MLPTPFMNFPQRLLGLFKNVKQPATQCRVQIRYHGAIQESYIG
jgi:hypothetical protein